MRLPRLAITLSMLLAFTAAGLPSHGATSAKPGSSKAIPKKKTSGTAASTSKSKTSTSKKPPASTSSDASKPKSPSTTPKEEDAGKTPGSPPASKPKESPSSSSKEEKPDEPAEGPSTISTQDSPEKKAAAVSSITPEELEGFDTYSPKLQQIIRRSLELTTQNLRYQFGSADPKAGGMDCSGTIYRVLQDAGFSETPRQSDEICRWVMRHTALFRTEDTSTLKDTSLSALQPGDLLFWSGTYETSTPRELPISHVMLYLGKRKKDGKPIVFGASDGRSYDGQRRNGVSVFDFVMPRRDGKAAFYGYGRIPGLTDKTSGGGKASS